MPTKIHARCVRVCAAVLALILVAWRPATAQQPIEVKAGISDPVNTVLAWYMARDAGLYAAEGLKVDIVNMSGGSRGAAELKGGVIGVSTFGSESDSTVTLALARLALTRNDVVLKEYGGGTRRLDALKSGEIKATPLNEPIASLARAQGVNVLVDLVPEQIPWVFSSIVVRRGDIAGRRDLLIRFLKGTIEGNYLALNDEKRAKEVLAKELKVADPKVLDITYKDFKAQSPADVEISQPGAENILAQFPGGSQKPEDYIDSSLIDALRTEGYFAAMAQKYKR